MESALKRKSIGDHHETARDLGSPRFRDRDLLAPKPWPVRPTPQSADVDRASLLRFADT